LSLLPQELHAIEHLLGASTSSVEPFPKPIVLALELGDPTGHLDARRAAISPFQFLELGLGGMRSTPKAGELFAEVLQQHFQLGNGAAFTRSGV
jgi:hypothetical protein